MIIGAHHITPHSKLSSACWPSSSFRLVPFFSIHNTFHFTPFILYCLFVSTCHMISWRFMVLDLAFPLSFCFSFPFLIPALPRYLHTHYFNTHLCIASVYLAGREFVSCWYGERWKEGELMWKGNDGRGNLSDWETCI